MMVEAGASRRTRRWFVAGVVIVVGVLLALWLPAVWRSDVSAGTDASAPSCSWPVEIQKATPNQARLIRCYLRAVAHRSVGGLRGVVRSQDDGGPIGFSTADFTNTHDAGSGTATAIVIGNGSDGADADVVIRYADGARKQLEIHLANPSSTDSWRFWNVGTYPSGPNPPGASRSRAPGSN